MNENRNIANINMLADYIEQHTELEFNMAEAMADPKCGSAGCIGGFAAVLWPEVRACGSSADNRPFSFYDDVLANKLGIDQRTVNDLCYPGYYQLIPREVAVAELRSLAETGQVTWPPIQKYLKEHDITQQADL